jgi:hypothetical protein
LREPSTVPSNYSNPAAWALSATINGSPGVTNGPVFTTDFTLWQQAHFSSADVADLQRSGLLADPDGDGASNLLEMSLATGPLDPNSRPVLSVTAPTFTFTRLRQTLGLDYTIEESTDCMAWTPIAVALQVISQSDTTETVRAALPQSNATKRFLRLRITKY